MVPHVDYRGTRGERFAKRFSKSAFCLVSTERGMLARASLNLSWLVAPASRLDSFALFARASIGSRSIVIVS